LKLISLDVYPYRLENLLVGIAQAGAAFQQLLPSPLAGDGLGVRGRREQNTKLLLDGRLEQELATGAPGSVPARADAALADEPPVAPVTPSDLEQELATLRTFAEGLPRQRRRIAQYLGDFCRQQGPIAVLGAGHLACAFINYLQLEKHLAFVVDDNPHKQGLFMPGSRLPIRSSQALLDDNIRLCLLSVNPEVEDQVLQRNRGFVERGGRFASIFAASNRALFA
jgi:hypothetical protein